MIKAKCSGCQKTVKGQAKHAGRRVKCPNCGELIVFPTAHESPDEVETLKKELAEARRAAPAVQTTQATSKVWKLVIAIGSLGMLAAGVAGVSGFSQEDGQMIANGVLGFAAAFLVYLVGRIGKWWCHE